MIIETTNLPLDLEGYAVPAVDSFLHAFTTKKNSVIGHYRYGTDAYKLKHRSYGSEFLIDFKRCCKDACKFDKRLKFTGVQVDESQVSAGILNFIVNLGIYQIKGFLNV